MEGDILVTAQAALESLNNEVYKKTYSRQMWFSGAAGGPISRDDVKVILTEAIKELRGNPEMRMALLAHGLSSSSTVGGYSS